MMALQSCYQDVISDAAQAPREPYKSLAAQEAC
jgi:hypothetical protein